MNTMLKHESRVFELRIETKIEMCVILAVFFFFNERGLKNFLSSVKKQNKTKQNQKKTCQDHTLQTSFQFAIQIHDFQVSTLYRLVSSPLRPTSFLPPVKRAERNRALWLNDFATFCKRKYEMTESSAWLIYAS